MPASTQLDKKAQARIAAKKARALASKLEQAAGVQSDRDRLASIGQADAAWLVSRSARWLREVHAPRNGDGSYSGRDVVAWLVERITSELSSDLEQELKNEKLREQVVALQRARLEAENQLIAIGDVRTVYGALAALSRDASRQAERQWGPDGLELWNEFWQSFDETFEKILDGDKDLVLCRRVKRGRGFGFIPVKG